MPQQQPQAKAYIVDDDEAVRESTGLLMELHGLTIEMYASTAAFAQNYREPACGCLILDQHLPTTTGLEFLGSEAGKNIKIPIILITGQGDASLKERAFQQGVAAYLEKPLREEVLLETVDRVLSARS